MNEQEAREALAGALPTLIGVTEDEITDLLMPVVRGIVARELRETAEEWDTGEDARYASARIAKSTAARVLRDRADGLEGY